MKSLILIVLLCWARPVSADMLFTISAAAAVVGHSMDLAETQHCLGSGRCREVNPWLLRFESPSGFAVAKMSVATLGIWATSKIPNKKWAAVVNFAVGAAYTSLAIRNARVGK